MYEVLGVAGLVFVAISFLRRDTLEVYKFNFVGTVFLFYYALMSNNLIFVLLEGLIGVILSKKITNFKFKRYKK